MPPCHKLPGQDTKCKNSETPKKGDIEALTFQLISAVRTSGLEDSLKTEMVTAINEGLTTVTSIYIKDKGKLEGILRNVMGLHKLKVIEDNINFLIKLRDHANTRQDVNARQAIEEVLQQFKKIQQTKSSQKTVALSSKSVALGSESVALTKVPQPSSGYTTMMNYGGGDITSCISSEAFGPLSAAGTIALPGALAVMALTIAGFATSVVFSVGISFAAVVSAIGIYMAIQLIKCIKRKSPNVLQGGSRKMKKQRAYIKTGRRFVCNDGIERVVYTYDGHDYIKRKNKQTGKYNYRKLKPITISRC